MLNTKSQSLSTFTNLFRLPPPGYTLPASNILHKLTHQPLWKHASGLPPPLHKLNLKFHMIITTTHQHPLETAHATIASYRDIALSIDSDGQLRLQPQ